MNNLENLSENLQEEIASQPVTRIKIADAIPYSKHPFQVADDKALELLAEDIKVHGLINPIVVRVYGFGDKYEILSGHRRVAAQKLNGAEETDARIVKVTDDEAARIVIVSNFLQRDKILPSERAKSYMLRNECLKREKYGSQSTRWTEMSDDIQGMLSEEFNVSKSAIFEYIRLNYLIEPMLNLADSGKMKIKTAVSLSYFSAQRQEVIYKYFFTDKKASLKPDVLKEMKKHMTDLTEETLDEIIAELTAPKQEKIKPVDRLFKRYASYFKSEQEFADRLDKLMRDYLKRENIQLKKNGEQNGNRNGGQSGDRNGGNYGGE